MRWSSDSAAGVQRRVGQRGSSTSPPAMKLSVKSGWTAYWKRCASSQNPGDSSQRGNGGAQTSPSPAPKYHLSGRGARSAAKGRDRPEQLGVVAPQAELGLRVMPAQHAPLVNQEVGAPGEELVLEQHVVRARHLPLEVGEEIDLHPVLGLELPQRRDRIHADGEHRRVRPREAVEVLAEPAQLGGAGGGEGEGEESQQHVLPPPVTRQRHVRSPRGRPREIRRRLPRARAAGAHYPARPNWTIAYSTAPTTNPVVITPLTFSIGLVVAPVVAFSALSSTSATTTSRPTQYAVVLAPTRGGRWLAAPMKNSIGIESTTLVREARNARRPAAPAAGFAWPPAAAITTFWFGQITRHTLKSMTVPSSAPLRIATPQGERATDTSSGAAIHHLTTIVPPDSK